MNTGSKPHTLGFLALVAAAACASPSEPGQQLIGSWELVALESFPIPGWVRSCQMGLGCDSSYVASGRLTFEPDSKCSSLRTNGSNQAPYVGRCTYDLTSSPWSLMFEGNPIRFGMEPYRDPTTNELHLVLWGPPCDLWAIVCSQYTEDYRKTKP